jgi:hypothetical protein
VNDEHPLSDAQIEVIAEKAATRALEKIYAEVGQNVLRKLFWIVGLVTVSLALFLAGKGALR